MKYREENYNEEWMMIATTDHGRDIAGYHHGGQSARERTTWIAVNQPVNERMTSGLSASTDINPSICKFMGFKVPVDVEREQDVTSFYGQSDIMEMYSIPSDSTVILTWTSMNDEAEVTVLASPTNDFKAGGKDEYIELGTVSASAESYTIDLAALPASKFYKFVLETPNGSLNRWYNSIPQKYTHYKIPFNAE